MKKVQNMKKVIIQNTPQAFAIMNYPKERGTSNSWFQAINKIVFTERVRYGQKRFREIYNNELRYGKDISFFNMTSSQQRLAKKSARLMQDLITSLRKTGKL